MRGHACRTEGQVKKNQDPAEIAPPQKSAREYRVYPALIERCTALEPVTTAVAHPCDESSLTAAVEATEADLIRPSLVGLRRRSGRSPINSTSTFGRTA
jgi:hypothetical protein